MVETNLLKKGGTAGSARGLAEVLAIDDKVVPADHGSN